MAKTMQEKFIIALEARGETQVKETWKYKVYTCKQGGGRHYYIGRAGALRIGANIATSHPVAEATKQALLASVGGTLSPADLG